MSEATAIRRDPESGVVEEVSFFGDSPRVIGWTHIPGGEIIGTAVICSATHAELLKSYHVEVQIARHLARNGVAVQRFHYRGDGNSEGNIEDITRTSMLEDAGEAKDRLISRVGAHATAMIGVRLGGFPAAELAVDGGPLVLLDPVLDTSRFFQDAIRSHAISALKGEGKPERAEVLLERLANEGKVELLGYEIGSDFHRSFKDGNLSDLNPKGPVLLAPFGDVPMDALADPWKERGIDVVLHSGTSREAWWLDEQVSMKRHQNASILVLASAGWIVDQFGTA